MSDRLEKILELDNVVPASTLVNQEGYAVDMDGAKTTTLGQWARGVVYEGRGANEASVIVIHGIVSAKVDGSGSSIAKGDALCAGSAGKFYKATVGSHEIRAHAREAVSTDTDAQIELL